MATNLLILHQTLDEDITSSVVARKWEEKKNERCMEGLDCLLYRSLLRSKKKKKKSQERSDWIVCNAGVCYMDIYLKKGGGYC